MIKIPETTKVNIEPVIGVNDKYHRIKKIDLYDKNKLQKDRSYINMIKNKLCHNCHKNLFNQHKLDPTKSIIFCGVVIKNIYDQRDNEIYCSKCTKELIRNLDTLKIPFHKGGNIRW